MNLKQKLTVRHLRLISTLGRELNITIAAQILHTSQSAVSRGLTEIEALVGVALFERSTRRMKPTKFGEVLIWHADQIIGQLGRADAEIEALSSGQGPILDVGVIGAFSPELLTQALLRLISREPNLRARLHRNVADGLLADLKNGRVNLGLTHLDTRDLGDSELVIHRLYDDGIGILVAEDHPLARAKNVSWKDLSRENWVVMPIETSTRRILERNLLPHSSHERRVFVETMEIHYILSLVKSGAMITALPMSLVLYLREQLGFGSILSLADNSASWTVCIAHRQEHVLSRIEELFISCLKQTKFKQMDQALRVGRIDSQQ